MFEYVFTGKVLPERVDFSLTGSKPMKVKSDTGMEFELTLSIQKSNIFIKIKSEKEIEDIQSLKNGITDFVRLYTDAYGYLHGYAYDIEITSLIQDNPFEHTIFGVNVIELESDFPNRPIKDMAEIIELLNKIQFLRVAFGDLRLAIKYPKDTGVFAYRAIESLMQFFNKGGQRKKAWEELSKNLNISKSWIDYVRDFALEPRHGKPKLVNGADRVEIMKHTWKIVDRFIVYLKNDQKPLDKATHPELS